MKSTHRFALSLTVALFACHLSATAYATSSDYFSDMRQWQQDRLAELRAADSGMGVTCFDVLPKGASRIGAGADEDIVLSSGPAGLGVPTNEDGDGQMLIVFAERTLGRETYGRAGFLFATAAPDGSVHG